MKIRTCFVSNSSSSSFVCEVCGKVEGGWDLSLSEVGMTECQNGHLYCTNHSPNYTELKRLNDEREDENHPEADQWIDCFRGESPSECCPICQLNIVPDYLIADFLRKSTGKNQSELSAMIKARFGTFENFNRYLRN